jgi:hypothetical protein
MGTKSNLMDFVWKIEINDLRTRMESRPAPMEEKE